MAKFIHRYIGTYRFIKEVLSGLPLKDVESPFYRQRLIKKSTRVLRKFVDRNNNGSLDGIVEKIKELFPGVEYYNKRLVSLNGKSDFGVSRQDVVRGLINLGSYFRGLDGD